MQAWLNAVTGASDLFSVWKIDTFTSLLKTHLPEGLWSGPQGTVYLTYDDGPDPETTPYLLELLHRQKAKATFFLVGDQIRKHPELVQAIHREGHSLGNHTSSHSFLPALSVTHQEKEITETNRLITEITGETPLLFRPPFGIMGRNTGRILKEQGMTPVYWSSAPEDWSLPGVDRVIGRVNLRLKEGALIVLHEGHYLGKQTVEATKAILYKCSQRPYQLAKVNPLA